MSKHNQGDSCQSCLDKLIHGHPGIVEAYHFIKTRHPDVHCSWIYRGPEDQEKARSSGASLAKFGQSKHNLEPAQAMDLFQIDENGIAIFDPKFCSKLNAELKEAGFKLKWGGDFKKIGDYCHWETVSVADSLTRN